MLENQTRKGHFEVPGELVEGTEDDIILSSLGAAGRAEWSNWTRDQFWRNFEVNAKCELTSLTLLLRFCRA